MTATPGYLGNLGQGYSQPSLMYNYSRFGSDRKSARLPIGYISNFFDYNSDDRIEKFISYIIQQEEIHKSEYNLKQKKRNAKIRLMTQNTVFQDIERDQVEEDESDSDIESTNKQKKENENLNLQYKMPSNNYVYRGYLQNKLNILWDFYIKDLAEKYIINRFWLYYPTQKQKYKDNLGDLFKDFAYLFNPDHKYYAMPLESESMLTFNDIKNMLDQPERDKFLRKKLKRKIYFFDRVQFRYNILASLPHSGRKKIFYQPYRTILRIYQSEKELLGIEREVLKISKTNQENISKLNEIQEILLQIK